MAFRSVVTLSRRESEVAALVRDGLTNREIASRLFISERTVEGHVAQICNKLGFRSRIQIATRLLEDDSQGASRPARSRPFRVVSLPIRPPWWVLGIMGLGAPLALVAALYPWQASQPSTAIAFRILVTSLAVLFVVIPIVALVGLRSARSWAEPLAIQGLLGLGSLVLLIAAVMLGSSLASGKGFRAADAVEFAYAIAVVPLLLIHAAGLAAVLRQAPVARLLVTVVSVFWIFRYGYGLSLSALVLWLLWSEGRTARGTSR